MSSEVIKGAFAFFSGTFLSRITGLIRDLSMAFCFGSHPILAAFLVAYRLANVFRRLLGEGPLSSGLIPYFESIRQKSALQGALFFRDLFFTILSILLGVLVFSEVVLWIWIPYASGYKDILYSVFLMMPGIVFICLYGICSAVIQCEKKFFLSGAAPVFFNAVWIAAVWLLWGSSPNCILLGLCFAVVVGFFLQWACLVPSLVGYFKSFLSWKDFFSFKLFSCDVKTMIKPVFFGLIGACGVQINSALDAIFARFSSLEGPAFLWYAIRIEQLPIALFGIAVSSALLPPLSRALSLGDFAKFRLLLQFALVRGCNFIFPCMVALLVLAASGVNLLYGRGNFNSESVVQTVYCLWGYGLGLLPALGVLFLTPAFYSQKDFKAPMWAALFTIVVNVFFNALFVFGFHWGAFSISLATSFAAWANFFLLAYRLNKQGVWKDSSFFSASYKMGLCSLLAGGMTMVLGAFFLNDSTIFLLVGKEWVFSRGFTEQFLQFFALSGFFLAVLISLSFWVKVEDVVQALQFLVKRGVKKLD